MEARIIEAAEGMEFHRIHDGMNMGAVIFLGIDYSTGIPREDMPEYYVQVLSVEGG
jgi:hypothetical protein